MSSGENGTARAIAVVVLITLLVSGAYVATRFSRSHGNPSRFAFAGDKFVNAAEAPPSLYIYKNSYGFDGIGFYRIAMDPFTRAHTAFGITFDLPAFRLQRILYPFLVWATTGGNPERVAWGLIAWNLLGMAVLALLGVLFATSMGRKPYWGLVLALAPAFAVSLGLDTAEIIAGVFLLSGLLWIRRRRFVWAAAALTLAALTRETTLIISVAGSLVWLWKRIRPSDQEESPPLWTFLAPAIVQVTWQFILWLRWKVWAIQKGSAVDIGLPFRGIGRTIRRWVPPSSAQDVFHIVLVVSIALFIWTVLRSLGGSRAPLHEKVAWTLTAILMPFFQFAIWFHYWGFMRALSEFTLLGILVILDNDDAPRHRLYLSIALWAAIALQLALYP